MGACDRLRSRDCAAGTGIPQFVFNELKHLLLFQAVICAEAEQRLLFVRGQKPIGKGESKKLVKFRDGRFLRQGSELVVDSLPPPWIEQLDTRFGQIA